MEALGHKVRCHTQKAEGSLQAVRLRAASGQPPPTPPTRGKHPHHQEWGAQKKVETAQTGSHTACAAGGAEVGAVTMASVYQTQEQSQGGALAETPTPQQSGWGEAGSAGGSGSARCRGFLWVGSQSDWSRRGV